jgi:tetratricopeptide (TPR) repeat protein
VADIGSLLRSLFVFSFIPKCTFAHMKFFSFNILLVLLGLTACVNSEKSQPKSEEQEVQEAENTAILEQQTVGNDSLNNWIADHPSDAEALAARAQYYIDQKNLKYAYADAQSAFALDTLNTDVLLVWGDIHFLTNKTRVSRDAWETCIRLDKQHVECRLKLAELYNIVQEYRKSLQLVDEVIAIDPNEPIAYYIKGINIRDMRGDTATALQYFQKAIDLDNNYTTAIDMMGVMLAAQKDPLAIAYFNRLLEIKPNDHATYYNMGMFYLKTKDWNKAIETFTKCTQIKRNDIESLFNLGYIHLQLGVNDIARDYFTDALRIQPINHRALYGRAYAQELLGDIINAEKDYREALTYNPQHEPSRIGLERIQKIKNQR